MPSCSLWRHCNVPESGHEDHPEPDDEIHILVEQVDGQYTLEWVALDVTKDTDLEVTHRHTRKRVTLSHIRT